MSAADVARRLADRLDENGIPYAIGGALALGVWGAPRNTVDVDISVFVDPADLERLFAVRDNLEIDYVREWLGKMVPAGDPRHDALDDLVARFGRA